MNEQKSQKLMAWINALSEEKAKSILHECISELILTEVVNYYPDSEGDYEGSRLPYWDATGERLG